MAVPSLKQSLRLVIGLRVAPLLLGYLAIPASRELIDSDVLRWQQCKGRDERGLRALVLLLSDNTPEFRNLYNYRLAKTGTLGVVIGRLLALVYTPEKTLFLRTETIGPGLFIQHGFASGIGAQSIGANCWINQQVTIGKDSYDKAPVIEDDVVVSAGAIILGGVRIGKGAHVGAGAVVVKDVPAGMVAVGVPAKNRPRGDNSRAHGPAGTDSNP